MRQTFSKRKELSVTYYRLSHYFQENTGHRDRYSEVRESCSQLIWERNYFSNIVPSVYQYSEHGLLLVQRCTSRGSKPILSQFLPDTFWRKTKTRTRTAPIPQPLASHYSITGSFALWYCKLVSVSVFLIFSIALTAVLNNIFACDTQHALTVCACHVRNFVSQITKLKRLPISVMHVAEMTHADIICNDWMKLTYFSEKIDDLKLIFSSIYTYRLQ